MFFRADFTLLNPLLKELRLYDVGLISDVFWGFLYIPELQKNNIIPVPLTVQIKRQGLKKQFRQNFIRIKKFQYHIIYEVRSTGVE